ncbi:MAG: hypothetical protein OHK0038_01270 [Flammeovirgaceae bacterium]
MMLIFNAFSQKVTLDKLPTTVDEFIEMRDKIAQTPEGGATTMIVALLLYAQNPEIGLPCLTIAIEKEQLIDGKGGYKDKVPSKSAMYLIEQISKENKKTYVPRSYFKGTSPENGYELPSGKLELEFSSNSYSGDVKTGKFKIFVKSSGADTARPITLKVNDKGIWKANEFSSLVVGVKAPTVKDSDDF